MKKGTVEKLLNQRSFLEYSAKEKYDFAIAIFLVGLRSLSNIST